MKRPVFYKITSMPRGGENPSSGFKLSCGIALSLLIGTLLFSPLQAAPVSKRHRKPLGQGEAEQAAEAEGEAPAAEKKGQ